MPAWLSLLLIVLVSVALFGDMRRNEAEEAAEASGRSVAPPTIRRPESPREGHLPSRALHRRSGRRLQPRTDRDSLRHL